MIDRGGRLVVLNNQQAAAFRGRQKTKAAGQGPERYGGYMTKPRLKPPTIILDNSCGDAQNPLRDSIFVELLEKLIEAVNQLYVADGFGGLSLKSGWGHHTNDLWRWRTVAQAEVRLHGATLVDVTVATWSSGLVDVYENRANRRKIVATRTASLATDFYKVLRERAKALESCHK